MKNLTTHEKIENEKNVIDKKTGSVTVSSVVELVVTWWGRPTMVVIVAQGEILGVGEYVF
jgi:hypothetical protein